MKRRRTADKDLPQYLVEAIRQVWPHAQVGMPDDAPFRDTYPRLKERLARIPGARILYEQEPRPAPSPEDGSEEGLRSYCLFFLSTTDERFEFGTEDLEQDEDGVDRHVPGKGWMGCLVGISVVAPFAAVSLDQFEVFENGASFEPDVEPHFFNVNGGKLDMDSHFLELLDEEGFSILQDLRAGMIRVLKELEIDVIPEVDLDRPVPWLSAEKEVSVGKAVRPITVRQAFFFRRP